MAADARSGVVRAFGLVAAGLCGGLALGWSLFGGSSASTPGAASGAVEATAERAKEARLPQRLSVEPAPVARPPGPIDPPRPRPASPAPAGPPPQELDLPALRERLARVERELAEERALRQLAEGDEVKAPEGLPARFQGDQLRSSMTAAFRELGLEAEVTSVDCTEYPCILYGEGFGSREEAEQLRGSAAMKDYADDARMVYGWHDSKEGGTGKRTFGVALYPTDDRRARGEPIRQRVEWRVRGMKP